VRARPAVLDRRGQQLAQHPVGVRHACLRDPADGVVDDRGGGVPAKDAAGNNAVAPVALCPRCGARHKRQGFVALPPKRRRRPSVQLGEQLLARQHRDGQHPLPLLGRNRQRRLRGAKRNARIDVQIRSGHADHIRNEFDQLLTPVVGHVIVHLPRELGEQRVRAGRMVAPSLAGEVGRVLHEARTSSRAAVLSAR